MSRVRVLFLDVRDGVTTPALLAALLDLGVAPSPLLAAVAELDLPVVLHLEPGRVERVPPEGELLVSPAEVMHALAPLAADAVGRLVVDELEGDARGAAVDGGVLAIMHAAALAVDHLAPDLVLVSDVGDEATPDALALLESLAPDGEPAEEPSWPGYVARGRAKAPPRVEVALGRLS